MRQHAFKGIIYPKISNVKRPSASIENNTSSLSTDFMVQSTANQTHVWWYPEALHLQQQCLPNMESKLMWRVLDFPSYTNYSYFPLCHFGHNTKQWFLTKRAENKNGRFNNKNGIKPNNKSNNKNKKSKKELI